jgi:hypothetical protein
MHARDARYSLFVDLHRVCLHFSDTHNMLQRASIVCESENFAIIALRGSAAKLMYSWNWHFNYKYSRKQYTINSDNFVGKVRTHFF